MWRPAKAILSFFRLAFWPLAAAFLVVLLLQPIYICSLTALGHVTSHERIVAHLNAAFEQGVLADSGNPRSLIFKGGEQLAECISLGSGLDPPETPWQNAISGAYPVFRDTHECEGLHRAAAGAPVTWRPYFRYWHGYRVILAPLESAFPIWVIKLVNALLLAGACWLLWTTLRDTCDKTVATIFLVTYVCLSDALFVWRTSPHSLSLAYIIAGASLFAHALQKNWSPFRLIVLAAVFGSAFNFIDFLVNPPMMPMLIAFFVLLNARANAGLLAIAVVLAWFGGYAETWIAKWVLAYLALPPSANVTANIFSAAEARTAGAFNGVYLFPLAATVRAFLRAMDRAGVIVVIILALAIAHYCATVSRIDWRRMLWLSSPVLVSALWFEALSSHTQFHLTPSSRSAAMALAIIVSAAVIAMPRHPNISEIYAQLGLLAAKLPLLRPRKN